MEATTATDWLVEYAPDVEAVHGYCARHNLFEYARIAFDLARQCFHVVGMPFFEVEDDPETGEECLALNVPTRGTSDEISKAYRSYQSKRAALIPWPQCLMIRLYYNWAE